MKNLQIFFLFLICKSTLNSIYIPKKAIKKLNDQKLSLFFGIDNNDLKSSEKIEFFIDFHFCSIIVHDQIICESQNSCRILNNSQKDQSIYKDQQYNYAKIKTFLGLNKQVTTTITTKEVVNYVNLPIRKLGEQHTQFSNVLGLSINSPIWQHWIDLYNFKEDVIHFDIILEQDNEQIIFYNAHWPLKETWIPIVKNKQRYEWNMQVIAIFKNLKDRIFNANFTFENDKDLFFELNNDMHLVLMRELCLDIDNCTKKEHLRPSISLQKIYFRSYLQNPLTITLEDLFEIDEDQTIKFYFTKYHSYSTNADIILQKRFFQRYYISIQNSLQNQKYYHLKINNLDTLKKRFQNRYFKFVFMFFMITFIIAMSYATYSKLCVRKKVLQDLEKDFYENVN